MGMIKIFISVLLLFNFSNCIASVEVKQSINNDKVSKLKKDLENGNLTLGVANEFKDFSCTLNKIANALGKQMGMMIRLEFIPGERLVKLVGNSLIHGDFAKGEGYLELAPNAIEIKNSIKTMRYHAFSLSESIINVSDWDSLKKYKLVEPRGYSLVKSKLKDHNVHLVGSLKAAFGYLKAKKADLIVIDTESASLVRRTYAPEFDGIIKLHPALGYFNLKTYISEKYPDIVERYNNALGKVTSLPEYPDFFTEKDCP